MTDFEDLTKNSQDDLLKARLEQIKSLGSEGPVTAGAAKELPTSILVMSVVKYPDLIMEAGSLLPAAAQEGELYVAAVQATMATISESLKNCCQELDIRIPARDSSDVV